MCFTLLCILHVLYITSESFILLEQDNLFSRVSSPMWNCSVNFKGHWFLEEATFHCTVEPHLTVTSLVRMGLEVAESLPAGSGEDWLCWRALNRLRTGVGREKTVMRRWGYLDDAQSVDCDYGEPQTMAHLLSCRLLDEACTTDDLATVTERAKACAHKWEKSV